MGNQMLSVRNDEDKGRLIDDREQISRETVVASATN
jgi:hypothetical protein